ncbi:unnamed protein product [Ostreobium quekettii]|uniref:Uncharacterized protein n=1 Tax=Ostreobium quekettii TaxID=121088 RepID=A0A8S1J7Y1_9CHLO|nr:unnamed protein product [Ostreobium quekettii]
MDDVERNLDDPKAFPASDFAHSAPETGENGSAATDPSATPSTTPSALDADDVFNPDTHVLLGQELKTDRQVKVVLRALYWTAALSAGALAAVFALKARLSGRPLIDTRRLHQLNAAFAALHLGASAATAVVLALRLRLVARAGLAWSKRRRRWVNLYSSQLALVMLLAAAFLAPNAHMLTNPCGHVDAPVWVAHGVRFTCWNSLLALFVIGVRNYTPSTEAADRPDAILLDAPWRVHWPVGVYWMAFEVGLAVAVAGRLATSSAETACREIESGQCDPGGVWLFSAILFGVLFIGYVAMYARSARRAFVELGNKAYCEFRWTNVDLRYQVRIGTLVMLFGLADILLWFAEMRSCLSFVMARFGLLPAEFSVTAFTIVDCAFMLPGRPGTRPPEDAAHGLENYRCFAS